MTKTRQDRWECPWCGASGWWTPSTHIGRSPRRDHARKDVHTCLKAQAAAKDYAWDDSQYSRPDTHEEGSPDQDPSNGDGFDRDF